MSVARICKLLGIRKAFSEYSGNLDSLGGLSPIDGNPRRAHGDEIISRKVRRETSKNKFPEPDWDNGFNLIKL